MNKLVGATASAVACLAVLAACGTSADEGERNAGEYESIEWENSLELIGKSGGGEPAARDLDFNFSENYSVTSGQPWEGVFMNGGNTSNLTITARAGRQSSSAPGDFFAQNLNGGGWCGLDSLCSLQVNSDGSFTAEAPPSEFNFAFTGTLSIEGNTYPTVLGQIGRSGQASIDNCWYIGGPGWTGYSYDQPNGQTFQDNYVQVFTPDKKYFFYSETAGAVGGCAAWDVARNTAPVATVAQSGDITSVTEFGVKFYNIPLVVTPPAGQQGTMNYTLVAKYGGVPIEQKCSVQTQGQAPSGICNLRVEEANMAGVTMWISTPAAQSGEDNGVTNTISIKLPG